MREHGYIKTSIQMRKESSVVRK